MIWRLLSVIISDIHLCIYNILIFNDLQGHKNGIFYPYNLLIIN